MLYSIIYGQPFQTTDPQQKIMMTTIHYRSYCSAIAYGLFVKGLPITQLTQPLINLLFSLYLLNHRLDIWEYYIDDYYLFELLA